MVEVFEDFSDQNRKDEYRAEDKLIPHETCRPVGRERLMERVFVPSQDFEEKLAATQSDILSGCCLEEACHSFLSLLTADEKMVVTGYFYDDCPLEEIAVSQGIDICLIRRTMISAMKKMRQAAQAKVIN